MGAPTPLYRRFTSNIWLEIRCPQAGTGVGCIEFEGDFWLSAALDEVVLALGDPQTAESGGAHNQKEIEFQKNWAIVKMFALKEQGVIDFLFLFEAVQDVAVLNSSTTPTAIEVFQLKKKDRKEWTWASLTNLHVPDDPSKKPQGKAQKTKPLDGVSDSPVGKLFAALSGFKTMDGSGKFVSNAGCDLELAGGGNAATSLPVPLSALPAHFTDCFSPHSTASRRRGVPNPTCRRCCSKRSISRWMMLRPTPSGSSISSWTT